MPVSAGARGFVPNPGAPTTRDIMKYPSRGQSLTLREALAQGVGKAHRSVVYAHFDFRNYDRSYLGTTGRLT